MSDQFVLWYFGIGAVAAFITAISLEPHQRYDHYGSTGFGREWSWCWIAWLAWPLFVIFFVALFVSVWRAGGTRWQK